MSPAFNKIGFHAGPAGNHNGIGDYYRRLDEAGVPFVIKSVDHYGHIFEAAKYSNAPHQLAFRLSTHGQGDGYDYDVPDYSVRPDLAAERHWAHHLAKLPPEFDRERVWLEIINEVDKERATWLAQFAFRAGQLAVQDGYKLLMFGWASGEPERSHWDTAAMRDFLRLIERNHDQLGIALHEYSYNVLDIYDGYPDKIGRFMELFDVCDTYGIRRPQVFITEWGWQDRSIPVNTSDGMADIRDIAELYAMFPDIIGAATWYLGSGFGDTIANQTQRLIAPMIDYSLVFRYEGPFNSGPPDPPPAESPFLFDPYTRTILLHPRDLDDTQREVIMSWLQDGVPEIGRVPGYAGWSHQDALEAVHQAVMRGATNSLLVVVDGQQIGSGLDAAWIAAHYPSLSPHTRFVSTRPANDSIVINVPHLWQNDPTAPLPFDCGPASAAMCVHYLTDARPTVAEMGQVMGHAGDYTHFNDLALGMGAYGVASTHYRPMDYTMVRELLGEQRPIIALIKYGLLPPEYRAFTTFTGWHFLVIVGIDGQYVYCNDPLKKDGRMVAFQHDVFRAAWKGDGYNHPYQGMAAREKAPSPPPPPPAAGSAAFGLHASATPDISDVEHELFAQVKPDMIKVLSFHSGEDIARLAAAHPQARWVVRAFLSFGGRQITPGQFFNDTFSDVDRALKALSGKNVVVELHNEPNLAAEGLWSAWDGAKSFNSWYLQVLSNYKAALPGVRFIFPGLSPGASIGGVRISHFDFWEACRPAINESNGLGVHAYWSANLPMTAGASGNGLAHVDEAAFWFPGKPLFVTEASRNDAASASVKGDEYLQFWEELRTRPQVQGVTYFVASAHPGDFKDEVWIKDGRSVGIAEAVTLRG